jgi:hypothetical protein
MQTTLTFEPTIGDAVPLPWTLLTDVLAPLHSVDGGLGGGGGDGGGAGIGPTPLHSRSHAVTSTCPVRLTHEVTLCSATVRLRRLHVRPLLNAATSVLSCQQLRAGAASRTSTVLRT